MKKVIATSTAPAALGPYSQAVLVDQTLYASGQIGLKPETGSLNGADVTSQTKQIMANMGAVLTAAGMNYADVVKTTIFLTNVADFTVVNDLYATYFTDAKFLPARSTVQVAALPDDALIEIEYTATK
ncbi:Rid family detoxifying hydrolase [Loigolactobacillus backii]|uniref:Reactive intermediate/imine deaminase n=1 Tax=Loigolactobacillus backii TaxID=375175 RepID=A0A192GZX6_9LACO|nr:Rid family detoxifying hydrolase [Loigolactobacillus backii]ANK60843.1 reactive intermediate/imine deaminase [Loigolactobacillus backii]ANK61583.1 reactive intermediate/imine deaminase [Loigolactobacillus backii]ANK65795.1 reactive intermediate/imine deaminase [Loigolactobacillus backii]ANK68272.1 reactive intermediate/imine deaminase [Loigolactobacillus backii]ANK69219.1 reactive intermediate/imine deaminase [Loigolactobacillus backii]